MIIQHNIPALNAARRYTSNTNGVMKNLEKLSSGYRINRAGDDAAGLAISEKMRSTISGLDSAIKNAEDGLSLLNTAEAAMGEMHEMVRRMDQIAVQSANGTYSSENREAMQQEIDNMLQEIDRIATTTNFNNINLLDGTLEDKGQQTDLIQAIDVLAHGSTGTAGLENVKGVVIKDPVIDPSATAYINVQTAERLQSTLVNSIIPQAANAFLNTFSSLRSAVDNGQISNEIGLKVYGENSTTLAYVAIQYSYYGNGQIVPDQIKLNLSVNTSALSFDGNGDLTADSRRALETTIVHEMMHAFMDDTLTNGMIGATGGVLDQSNKFPGWFTEGMAQTAAGGCSNDNDWVNVGLGLTAASSTSDISAAVKDSFHDLSSGSTSSKYGTGYLACMYLGYLAANTPSSLTSSSLAGGLNTILSDLMSGKSLDSIINEISGGAYTSAADFENKFGDASSASFISNLLTTVGSTGNGGVVGALTANDLLPDNNTSSSAYQADINNEYVISSVGNNRNWNTGGSGKAGDGTPSTPGGGGSGGGNPGNGPIGALYLHVGATALEADGINMSIDDMHTLSLGLSGLSVTDADLARAAIDTCNDAIDKISENRAHIGAYSNRLEHTIANLSVTYENIQSSESRIRDVDMAREMMAYTKNNILIQSSQAMLSQANMMPQSVLRLLQ